MATSSTHVPIIDRPLLDEWVSERLVVIGDAAHPVLVMPLLLRITYFSSALLARSSPELRYVCRRRRHAWETVLSSELW